MTDTADSPFLAACRGEPHDRVPVWFMRQAGRALPEYREIRARHGMREVIATPELAARVTLQPVRRYGVDAAILFSDIVTPLEAIGVDVEIQAGVGPVIDQPVRSRADLAQLRPLDPDGDYTHVTETVKILVRELEVPLIGFVGAPFTLASYLVEGGPSRNYARTKAMLAGEPSLFRELLERLAEIVAAAASAQVRAGAQAIQLFDSWAGTLSPTDYEDTVLPVSGRVLHEVRALSVPSIHFGVTTGELLPLFAAAGPDVVGVDWRTPLDRARQRVPAGVGLQGNLDPAIATAPVGVVLDRARDVLRRSAGHPHYVFNLGHGVLPETDPATLEQVVDLVHREGHVGPPEPGDG